MARVDYTDPYRSHRSRNVRQLGLLLFFLGPIVLFFLYSCSGLHWPMWNPEGRLNGRILKEIGQALPPSAKVTHAAREAYMDSAEYYAIELPAEDVATWIEFIRSTQESSEQANPRSATIRVPTWWTPEQLPKMKVFDVSREHGYFRICYGENDGRLFIAWLEI